MKLTSLRKRKLKRIISQFWQEWGFSREELLILLGLLGIFLDLYLIYMVGILIGG